MNQRDEVYHTFLKILQKEQMRIKQLEEEHAFDYRKLYYHLFNMLTDLIGDYRAKGEEMHSCLWFANDLIDLQCKMEAYILGEEDTEKTPIE